VKADDARGAPASRTKTAATEASRRRVQHARALLRAQDGVGPVTDGHDPRVETTRLENARGRVEDTNVPSHPPWCFQGAQDKTGEADGYLKEKQWFDAFTFARATSRASDGAEFAQNGRKPNAHTQTTHSGRSIQTARVATHVTHGVPGGYPGGSTEYQGSSNSPQLQQLAARFWETNEPRAGVRDANKNHARRGSPNQAAGVSRPRLTGRCSSFGIPVAHVSMPGGAPFPIVVRAHVRRLGETDDHQFFEVFTQASRKKAARSGFQNGFPPPPFATRAFAPHSNPGTRHLVSTSPGSGDVESDDGHPGRTGSVLNLDRQTTRAFGNGDGHDSYPQRAWMATARRVVIPCASFFSLDANANANATERNLNAHGHTRGNPVRRRSTSKSLLTETELAAFVQSAIPTGFPTVGERDARLETTGSDDGDDEEPAQANESPATWRNVFERDGFRRFDW
jgi:hypothetical protein